METALIRPTGKLELLSQQEVAVLRDKTKGGLYPLLRSCVLAVLNCGNPGDDGKSLLEKHPDFDIEIIQETRGLKLALHNAPKTAFVDGVLINGIREHVFSVLRDIIHLRAHMDLSSAGSTQETTNLVFQILRNARAFKTSQKPNLIVCWGGHSINRNEYEYTKKVGHELGLRQLDICTGCGPGAMKGPMKGAAIAHAKQRFRSSRYIGISEPGIIAAEAPNPIVNQLIIMPDIEKRLEAFVRLGHGIIIFPGGVGTAEEFLYLLGILMHPDNSHTPFPVVLTGPKGSEAYFDQLDQFIRFTLGDEVSQHYRIIVDDPQQVAQHMKQCMADITLFRRQHNDAFYYNWQLTIERAFQHPFVPTHRNMSNLNLHRDQPPHKLAAHLRRAFSGIVAGNVKEQGIRAIEANGLFELNGDPDMMKALDTLLSAYVAQGRMKLPGTEYKPCYRIVSSH